MQDRSFFGKYTILVPVIFDGDFASRMQENPQFTWQGNTNKRGSVERLHIRYPDVYLHAPEGVP